MACAIGGSSSKVVTDWHQVLDGKVVFLTGAAGGIGSAICQACIAQGARVAATDINRTALDDLVAKILAGNEQKTDHIIGVELDIANESAIEQAVQQIVGKWGTIDVLINTAAVFVFGGVDEVTAENWARNFEVNVTAYAHLVKHITPIMKQKRAGSIVQIGSISGVIAQPTFLPYGAGKAAVIQMTKNLALDLGPYNIRCNSISPGLVVTPPVVAIATQNGGTVEAFSHSIVKDQCLKRPAAPQEIANLVVFLASDLCPFMTGSNVIADGGYTAV